MPKTVAETIVETLHAAGVRRVYGVAGDFLNGFTDALRRQREMRWVHVRHEEAAAFAAGAEAHVTGTLAVCAGSCGPGNLHLINGLFDCHRARVPVLAIAAQIPRSRSAAATSRRPSRKICSGNAATIANWSAARSDSAACWKPRSGGRRQRGVAVLVVPGDMALQDAGRRCRLDPPCCRRRPWSGRLTASSTRWRRCSTGRRA